MRMKNGQTKCPFFIIYSKLCYAPTRSEAIMNQTIEALSAST